MILFRPVGLDELRLMYEADMRAFPPRLPEQPIFYPVTTESYAIQIARDWNTKAADRAGFVTKFSVGDEYVSKFERRVVGAKEHEELWVPADELADFNTHIDGPIEVVRAFFGDGYRGRAPDGFGLRDKDAREQFVALARTLPYSTFDVTCEMAANHVAVFLNFFFWEQTDFSSDGIERGSRDDFLERFRRMWATGSHAGIALGVAATPATSSG